MPLVTLEPGDFRSLSPNENPKAADAVPNPSPIQGRYTMQDNGTLAVAQMIIESNEPQPFVSPFPEGITVTNNGDVSLTLKMPGL